VQKLSGQSTLTGRFLIARRVYAHVIEGAQEEAASVMDRLLHA